MKNEDHPFPPPPPPPLISMMENWARFDFCRDSSLIRGEGGGGGSDFSFYSIVGVLVWSAKTELFN